MEAGAGTNRKICHICHVEKGSRALMGSHTSRKKQNSNDGQSRRSGTSGRLVAAKFDELWCRAVVTRWWKVCDAKRCARVSVVCVGRKWLTAQAGKVCGCIAIPKRNRGCPTANGWMYGCVSPNGSMCECRKGCNKEFGKQVW